MTLQRWRVLLEYDGSDWAGWQRQESAPTIQGAVEAALQRLLGHPARVTVAGRTDAGVHAAGQVACFMTQVQRSPQAMRDGLSAQLPASVACLRADPVPDVFDPRRAPHRKTYLYTWLVRSTRSPLRAGRVWHLRRPLDVAAMDQAARILVGTHDFSSFRASGCSARTTVRTIWRCWVEAHDDEVRLRMVGTGFLRHMVRIVAGTVLEVGRGRREPDWVADVLAAGDRRRAGRTAPPRGLLLERIDYDESA